MTNQIERVIGNESKYLMEWELMLTVLECNMKVEEEKRVVVEVETTGRPWSVERADLLAGSGIDDVHGVHGEKQLDIVRMLASPLLHYPGHDVRDCPQEQCTASISFSPLNMPIE